jgi:hypothetical protein
VFPPALISGPEREPEPDEWAAEHTMLGVSDETLQLGADIVVTEGERGAPEAGQGRAQVFSDQRRQHGYPLSTIATA